MTNPALLSSFRLMDDGSAELEILDEIVRDSGWFGGVSDRDVRGWLATAGDNPITVRINSPGGDAFGGVSIYNALRDHSGAVSVVVSGVAASAASVIAMAGDTVTMQPGSMMMIHRAQALAFGTADDVSSTAAALTKMDASMADVYARRASADAGEISSLMAATHWMTAAEAVEQGFADSMEGDSEAAPVAVHPSTYAQWGTVPKMAASLFSVVEPKVLATRKHSSGTLSASGEERREEKSMPNLVALTAIAALLGCDADEAEGKVAALVATSDARALTIEEQGTRLAAFDAAEESRAAGDFEAMLTAGQEQGRWSLDEREGVQATLRAVGCLRASDLSDLPTGVYPAERHTIARQVVETLDESGPAPKHEQVKALALTNAEARGSSTINPDDLRRARRSVYGE